MSIQESRFDFLATRQQLGKIDDFYFLLSLVNFHKNEISFKYMKIPFSQFSGNLIWVTKSPLSV